MNIPLYCKYFSRSNLKFVLILFIFKEIYSIEKNVLCNVRINDDFLYK